MEITSYHVTTGSLLPHRHLQCKL